MKINFVSPQDSGGNKWRNWAMFFVLIIVLGGIGLSRIQINKFVDFSSIQKKIAAEFDQTKVLSNKIDESVSEVGGDIVFEPVKLNIPVLSASSIPLDPNSFGADCILAKDKETGTVLYRKNEYKEHPIASITKLMTALVLLEYNIDWVTTTIVIGPDLYGTHMYAGDVYSLEDLWNAMLIGSSNKAALSLVESINGMEDEFVVRMNKRAMELGMSDTTFTDVTGIEESNLSTASDILLLLQEILKHEKIRNALATKDYNLYSEQRSKSHHMWNTNWLILDDPNPWISHSFDRVIGGKTGHILAAGFNFTVEVEKDGHVIDIVVFGANGNEERFTEARDVGEWVFDNYIWE